MLPTTALAPPLRRSERAPKPKRSTLVDALRHQIAVNEDERDNSDFFPGGQSDDGGGDNLFLKDCDELEAVSDDDKKAKAKKTAKLGTGKKAKKERAVSGTAQASKRAKR